MPKGYVVVDVDVQDEQAYRPYREQAGPNVVANGGRYIVRGGKTQRLEGDWEPKRLVVLEFPSVEAARAWHESAAYQAIAPIRHRSAASRLLLAEGARGPGPFDLLPAPLRVAARDEMPAVGGLLRQLGCLREGPDLVAALERFQDEGTSAVVVLGPAGRPEAAATVHLLPQPGTAGHQVFVEDLVVGAEARGRGHGKTMLAALRQWAQAIGATWLRARGDEDSAGLFERAGLGRGDTLFEGRP